MKISQQQFLDAIVRIQTFSPAPLILSSAMKLLRDPQSDIGSIATLMGSDPALAADIIRSANSAFYGSGNSVQTIDQAVQKMGFRETTHLLSLAVGRIFAGRDLGSYGISADDFWAESLFNGLFMRNLATETGGADPGEAYAVGLMRFLGRLAINQCINELGVGIFWFGDQPIVDWELESVGFVQAQAVAVLLANWHFPDNMVQAIAWQDTPALLRERNWLADALFFSSSLIPQGLGGSFQTALKDLETVPPIGSEFMRECGLTPETVTDLVAATRQDYDRVRQNFSGGKG